MDNVDLRQVHMNRECKSSVFCDLFSDKRNALSLYNAINHTEYADETKLEIVTMDDVIYLHQKNDVSVLFDAKLTLWEHQSSLNNNMPLRGMMYYARNLEGILGEGINRLHWRKTIKIQAPDYYVLYNGLENMPDNMAPAGGYEFTAHMININVSHNEELLEKCPTLKGYAVLVQYSRDNVAAGLPSEDAVDMAVQRCIDEGILKEYLIKKRAEAVRMFLTEFDENSWRESMREEGRSEAIRIFVSEKRDDGVSDEVIKAKLKKYYKLGEEEIGAYLFNKI